MSGVLGVAGWNSWRLPITLARRELRTGTKGFRIFVTCLAIGVGLIGTVGSLRDALEDSLNRNARTILGGDIELRSVMIPVEPQHIRDIVEMTGSAGASEIVRMRTIGEANDIRRLVELKAVSAEWPLVGQIASQPAGERPSELDRADGFGALAEQSFLNIFSIRVGDRFRLGDLSFVLRGVLTSEPDRLSDRFGLGPRIIVSRQSIVKAGLLGVGALRTYHYRLLLPEPRRMTELARQIRDRYEDVSWTVRDRSAATPALRYYIRRTAMFLQLVGLAALTVGGIGIANSVRAHIASRITTIAIFRVLGASNRLVSRIYLLQILAMMSAGTVVGLAFAAAITMGLAWGGGEFAGLAVQAGFFPWPLAQSAAFGFAVALLFSAPALSAIQLMRPSALFRAVTIDNIGGQVRISWAMLVCGVFIGGLALITLPDAVLTGIVLIGLVVAFLALQVGARLVFRAAWAFSRAKASVPFVLRFGIANLRRPGARAGTVVASLGLGVAALTTVVVLQAGILDALSSPLTHNAPSFYALDIQPHQGEAFDALAQSFGSIQPERQPMLRGRITRLNGIPVARASYDASVGWALRGDRGVSFAASQPPHFRIDVGDWWDASYRGPPLISLSADLARGFRLSVGDSLTVSILGRPITGKIANLREVDWGSLRMNFTILFNPGVLDDAPYTQIATFSPNPDRIGAFFRELTVSMPNISVVPVGEVFASIQSILSSIAVVIQSLAVITALIGVLVLTGIVLASQRQQLREWAVFKAIGATRVRILATMTVECSVLGVVAVIIGGASGLLLAWVLASQVFELAHWRTRLDLAALIGVSALIAAISVGFLAGWCNLSSSGNRLLHND